MKAVSPQSNASSVPAPDSRATFAELRALTDGYFGASPLTLLAGMLGAGLACLLLAPALPGLYWTLWFPTAQALFVLRLCSVRWYGRRPVADHQLAGWQRLSWTLTLLQGLVWGGFGALVGLLHDPLHQSIVLVTVLVVVAGSASLVGAMPVVVPVFGVVTLTPTIAGLLHWQDGPHTFLAFCTFMFLLIVNFSLPRTVQRLIRRIHDVVTEKEQALARLQDAETMARVGHFVWDVPTDRIEISAQARRMFGLDEARTCRPKDVTAAVVADDVEHVRGLIRDALREGRPELCYETRVPSPTGTLNVQVVQRAEFGADGRALRVMSTVQDITPQKEAQRELSALAYNDALTGLSNRSGFQQMLRAALAAPRHDDECTALLMLDLDHFKAINDTLGHMAGDQLLREAAARLRACLRPADGLARLGGDEFAIVLHRLDNSALAASIAQRLIETLSQPFRIGELEVYVSASVGIAMHPADAPEAESLLRCADVAMFDAKAHGRSSYQFHNADQSSRAVERVRLDGDLRRAIERNELELHYQPKVEIASGRVVGAEALLRWRHGDQGLIAPDRFIPVAEETGLIVPIGEWVLRSACATATAWNRDRSGNGLLKIAVNLSPRQFWSPHFVAMVRAVLHDTGCRPEWIELEMTESLLIDSRGQVPAILDELRRLGFTLAIDDFGTGYSALGYLTRFPITTLKIDRSFVNDVAVHPARAGIVRAVIGMGHSLGLELVAEGVEDAAQAEALLHMGCGLAQGWLYGKPLPRAAFEQTHAVQPVAAGAPPAGSATGHAPSALGGTEPTALRADPIASL